MYLVGHLIDAKNKVSQPILTKPKQVVRSYVLNALSNIQIYAA